MFSLSELAPLNQHQSRCKLLKPWWEVFMDYLVVLMLMLSVLACTEQLSRDKVVCLPLIPPGNASNQIYTGENGMLSPSSKPPIRAPGPSFHITARGRRTHLVFQQYVYISQVLWSYLSSSICLYLYLMCHGNWRSWTCDNQLHCCTVWNAFDSPMWGIWQIRPG